MWRVNRVYTPRGEKTVAAAATSRYEAISRPYNLRTIRDDLQLLLYSAAVYEGVRISGKIDIYSLIIDIGSLRGRPSFYFYKSIDWAVFTVKNLKYYKLLLWW